MKIVLKSTFILMLLIAMGCQSDHQPVIKSAMTFNIRYDNPGDSINRWDNRKEELVGLLSYYHPDVVGLQEGLVHQLKYIQDNLKEYKMIGVGRDDGKEKGEFTALFYDSTKLKLTEESTFWLSETPDSISRGWDAALERICTYGLFENIKSGKQVFIFNTHYDHIGMLARENSSKLILKKIDEVSRKGVPIILMGDFNSTPDQTPIRLLQAEMSGISDKFYGPVGTFNGFDRQILLDTRIDYIFWRNCKMKTYRHVDDKMKNGNCISDHLPVLIEFQ